MIFSVAVPSRTRCNLDTLPAHTDDRAPCGGSGRERSPEARQAPMPCIHLWALPLLPARGTPGPWPTCVPGNSLLIDHDEGVASGPAAGGPKAGADGAE